jgi:hypothetical protein
MLDDLYAGEQKTITLLLIPILINPLEIDSVCRMQVIRMMPAEHPVPFFVEGNPVADRAIVTESESTSYSRLSAWLPPSK